MTDSANRPLHEEDADRDAAIFWGLIDVAEGTPLHQIGTSYRRPSDPPTFHGGVIGRPFMSWLLGSWLDAGLVEIWADTASELREEFRELGWLDRAIPERRWLILQSKDAHILVSDVALWGGDRVSGILTPELTDQGMATPRDEWIRIALASDVPPPPLAGSVPQANLDRAKARSNQRICECIGSVR